MFHIEQVVAYDKQEQIEHIEVIPTPPTYDEMLQTFCDEYGVDCELAKAIIMCESGVRGNKEIQEYQFTIKNPTSTASNPWQFLNSTWTNTMKRMGLPLDSDKHDPELSLLAGTWLLSQDGSRHWLESKYCWSKRI